MPFALFRRSNLPSFLLSTPAPPKAPHDASVRKWLKDQPPGLRSKHGFEQLARLMEKSLDRKQAQLDLSTADAVALDKVNAGLIQRLGAHVTQLHLPVDCPADILRRWALDLPHAVVTPPPPQPGKAREAKEAREAKQAFIRGAKGSTLPRAPLKVEGPRLPDAATDATALPQPGHLPDREEIHEAVAAARLLRAWLARWAIAKVDDRASLGSQDADAIARALLLQPRGLSDREQRAFTASQRLLAERTPGKPLQLSADQGHALDMALSIIETRADATDPVRRPYLDARLAMPILPTEDD
ncbi:hypothetical protein CDL60_01755 [Roseateles noduli]|nr:hypothetical protein CDL60_01755 [Roseateles noduli]